MGYEPRFSDDEIESYIPEGKEASDLSDYEREEIEDRYERDEYLDDEYYKADDSGDDTADDKAW